MKDKELAPKDCPSSNHPYRVHDWRWLGWPLDSPSSLDATCDYCGKDRGLGDQTAQPARDAESDQDKQGE